MTMNLTSAQVDNWKNTFEEYKAAGKVHDCEQIEADRVVVRAGLLTLLKSYLTGEIDSGTFRATFDQRTRTDWRRFGLKGMSGAMFLNKLVNHIPESLGLSEHLKAALSVPKDAAEARDKLRGFLDYLASLVSSQTVTEQQIQPRRTPFFLSAWWHMQQPEDWPIFYVSGRRVLKRESIYDPSQDVVDDYFGFRECFILLAKALGLKSWELEHVLVWCDERDANVSEDVQPGGALLLEPPVVVAEPVISDNDEGDSEPEDSAHAHVQWLLAKLGKRLGCSVWIAANDRKKKWNGERLGDLSIETLPNLGIEQGARRAISLIDILWIKGANTVAAAFEVEHTTSIYSGLLRMSDLIVLSPNTIFPLYIVTPSSRIEKVKRELSRPTFQGLELHKRCGFFSEENLIDQAEAMMQWASDVSSIEKLAMKVGDVNP